MALQAISSGGAAALVVDRPAGNVGGTRWRTAGADRWAEEASTTAESGANAGSNFALNAYSDAGTLLGTALTVNRATQVVTLTQPPVFDATNVTNTIAPQTHTATGKATPVDADEMPVSDSASSFSLKKLTWANLKATLLTWLQGTVFPSPGAIGSTTPAAGSFTTLSATGALTTAGLHEYANALGLWLTSSAWASNYKAIDHYIYGAVFGGSDGVIGLSGNAYYNGTNWIYKTTNSATKYEYGPNYGSHRWFTAPSGTANNAISFTQLMQLDSTGLAVTGGISATGALTTSGLKEAASGNLGLGVTPSAWAIKALDISNSGSFYGDGAVMAWIAGITQNAYYNAGWKYRATAPAADRYEIGGGHTWYTAPSGTAGNPITFTQVMTLDASGTLVVGATAYVNVGNGGFAVVPNSSSTTLAIGHINGTTSGSAYTTFYYNGGAIGSITQSGTTAVLYNTTSDYRLKANQQPLTGSGAFIDALKPTTWEWTRDGRKDAGFIAHEFQEVCPNAVNGVKDETEEQEYEVSPAVAATHDAEGNELTPAVPAVMGTRTVPKYQSMQASSAEVIANLVAELQSLRKRIAILEAK